MRALDLNLATRPFRNNTILWLGHGILALGVIVFTAWNTVTFVETGRTLTDQRSTVGSLANRKEAIEAREARVQAEIARHNIKSLMAETSRANDVIQRKAMSWTRLFNLLEATQPYEIRMVSVRPMFGGGARRIGSAVPATQGTEAIPVSVDGTAKDLRAFLEFERALIRDPHFDRVEPERTTHSKGGEVLFSLTFLYFPEETAKPKGQDQASTAGEDESESREAELDDQTAGSPKEPAAAGAPPVERAAETAAPAGAKEPPLTTSVRPPAVPPPSEAAVPLLTNVAAPSTTPAADADPAARADGPAGMVERPKKERPTTPIRKRPPGWQPPDPFAKEKKPPQGEQPAPAAGDRR